MSTTRIALIGAGIMGANHARTVAESSASELAIAVDADPERAQSLADRWNCRASTALEDALCCDAVIVATTTATHGDLALAVIDAGKPVMIEKPVAPEIATVRAIIDASEQRDVPVMCGFVERFNPALSTALALLEEDPIHALTVRHSPANIRASSSVVHDLLIHDIDAVIRIAADPSKPRVTAALWSPPGSEQSEIADCSLVFPDGFVGTLSASRWSQRKIRDITIVTEAALYEIDLLRVNLTVYRHVRQLGFGETATYRAETIVDVPFVRHAGEPLALQLQHFLGLANGTIDAASERATILAPHEVAFEVDKR